MTNASDLWQLARQELSRSNADRKHPFRYFSLATFGEYPELRTVVKRRFLEDFSVLFFTDSRSPKVTEIQNNPKVTALFYHPKKQLQIRLKGEAKILNTEDKLFREALAQIKQSASQKDYTTALAPGKALSEMPVEKKKIELHLAVIKIISQELDILQLGSAQHQRSRYQRQSSDNWEATPLVP